MKKIKLMTIVGTRPEIIKMSAIIKKCDKYFDHVIVHTGQNYDYTLNEVFFKELKLREPDYYLGVVGENLGQTMGNVIAKSYELMMEVKPDAVIVLGDTNSCLSVISAKRLKIPIFHMEAGNRCKDENLPEEVIRRIVDVTSDVNLCYSEHARRYILDSGVKPEYTYVVGSPMAEVLNGCTKELPDSNYKDYTIKRSDCCDFKKMAADFSFYRGLDFILLSKYSTHDEVKKNWELLKKQNVSKANYICNGVYAYPGKKILFSQENILETQIEKFVGGDVCCVSILNALPLFIYDYFKNQ